MSTFTGADLYRAFNTGDEEAVPWSAVSRDIQNLHTCAAAIVQQSHIEPRDALIIAYQHQLAICQRNSIWIVGHAEAASWIKKNRALDEQVSKLLGEEVKE